MAQNLMRYVAAAWLWVALAAQAATGVWTNVSGGYWADPANWQDGVVPATNGTSAGSGDVADFSALESGQTVTVTNTTFCGAMLFPNLPDAVWTVAGGALGLANAPSFLADLHGEIRVDGGTLNLAAPITSVNKGVAKTGAGTLRLSAVNTFTGITRLEGGTLLLTNGAMLAYSPVVFASPSATLALEGDAQVGGLETRCQPQSAVALNGHTLSLGGETIERTFGGTFTNGSLVFVRGSTQTFSGTQQVSSVRLENGGLNLGVGVNIAGWWRFDDPAQVGKDSGPRANHLVQSGTQAAWLTSDPERGSVLALDGAGAYLAGPNGGAVAGLPVLNMPFTVAFWFKPASDVNSTAGIYAWGASQGYRLNLMRLNTPSSAKPLVHTNYGNNREIPFATGLMDGAWHHVAVVYYGLQYQYYIDGELVDAYYQYTPLVVEAGNFVLGKGITETTFKGLLDDVFIAQGALEEGQLAVLRLSGQPPSEKAPADLLPETAEVEIAYNGKLRVAGDQTLAALGGAGAAGGVELAGGALLKVGGASRPAVSFDGSVSGEGTLVKCGADTTLTLGGRIDVTGAVAIAEGTLALANRFPSGLQAYYRFDDAENLGKDSSGHGYDLVASNTPAYAPGLFGGAASFTAAERDHLYAEVFPATMPTGNVSYTIAVWCNLKADGNLAGAPVYWGKGNAFDRSSAVFRFNTTTNIMTSNMGNNWTVNAGYDLAGDAPDGGWHHIVCTYDGATRERRVFFDGLPAYSTSKNWADLTIVGNVFWLGATPYSTANFYDGLLDEVMIFNRALGETEISDIVTGVFTVPWGSRLTDRVVARYSFEDAADLGKDSGPHGYHLSATGRVAAAAGKIGQALNLSVRENNQYVQGYLNWTNSVFPEALPTGNAPVTITAWVNPVTNPNLEGCMVFWGTTLVGRKGCHLFRIADSGSWYMVFRLVDGDSYVGADKLLTFDRGDREEGWHHVAAVVGPGGLRSLYVDGARVAANRVTGLTVDPGTFSVGYKPNAPTAWFQGLIDEVTVYDCALSRAELLETLRGRPDILSPGGTVDVAAAAVFDTGNAVQRVAALTGSGEVRLGGGVLTVAGGASRFDGALSGTGNLAVCDGAALTLAGTNSFAGSVTVSNAALLVSGAATGRVEVAVLDGGRLGGAGSISGNVVFENGAGMVAGSADDVLHVDGAVTLGATGTVVLPEGFGVGRLTLIEASTLSAPGGVAGWTVEPVPEHGVAMFRVSGGSLTLNVFRGGTVLSLW